MKTFDEFSSFYSSELLNEIKILEQAREKTANKILLVVVPVGFLILAAALFIMSLGGEAAETAVYVIFFGFLICAAISAWMAKGYVSDFKEKVIARIVKFLDPSFIYHKDQYISLDEFRRSKIFLQGVDRYSGDDYVAGVIGSTAANFSEIHAQYVTRDSKGRTRTHTIFKGLYFKADFNKHFKGHTLVLPDSAERMFGGLGKMLQSWNTSRPPVVRLEDPEFEKLFVVYGTDQIESRYILSTSLMRRIMDFKKKTGQNVYLSFMDSSVYVAISYARNLFEPKVFSTLLDFEPIKQYFLDLQLATGIVDDLNLNTRIWSKD